jgi:hypothetical protein
MHRYSQRRWFSPDYPPGASLVPTFGISGADLEGESSGLLGFFDKSGASIGAGAEGAFSFWLLFTES